MGKAWPGYDADHSPPSSASSAEVKNEYKLYLLSLLKTKSLKHLEMQVVI
jgi:hypothetical protein